MNFTNIDSIEDLLKIAAVEKSFVEEAALNTANYIVASPKNIGQHIHEALLDIIQKALTDEIVNRGKTEQEAKDIILSANNLNYFLDSVIAILKDKLKNKEITVQLASTIIQTINEYRNIPLWENLIETAKLNIA